jgi:hypothetical protein
VTRLVIQPPASFDEWLQQVELGAALQEMGEAGSIRLVADTMRRARAMVAARAVTDDGSPVDAALADCTFEQMLAIIGELVGSTAVPPPNGEPSPSPPMESPERASLVGWRS